MLNDRRLVALLDERDENLIGYATMLARLPQGSDAERVSMTGGNIAFEATVAGGTTLAAPQTLRYIDVPGRRAVATLVELSRHDETDALVVPETAGRGLARALARRAACSIWFVPTGAQPRLQRLLVPIDFSLPAADALRVGTGLGSLSGGSCLALHVYFNELVMATREHAGPLFRARARQYLDFTDKIDCLNVPVTPLFEESADVAATIVRVAHEGDADLIVLACRGRGLIGHLLRPSIADQVLRVARVPVLVLKHFGARRGLRSLLAEPVATPTIN